MPVDFEGLVLTPCMHIFGNPVTYQYQSGQALQIKGVFDEPTRLHDPMTGMDAGDSGVVASRVMIGVCLADLPVEPGMGDRVIINEHHYYVQEVQKDGQGGAHLVLNHAEV